MHFAYCKTPCYTYPWSHKTISFWPLAFQLQVQVQFLIHSLWRTYPNCLFLRKYNTWTSSHLMKIIHGVHKDLQSIRLSCLIYNFTDDTDGIVSSRLHGGTCCHKWIFGVLFDINPYIWSQSIHDGLVRSFLPTLKTPKMCYNGNKLCIWRFSLRYTM